MKLVDRSFWKNEIEFFTYQDNYFLITLSVLDKQTFFCVRSRVTGKDIDNLIEQNEHQSKARILELDSIESIDQSKHFLQSEAGHLKKYFEFNIRLN